MQLRTGRPLVALRPPSPVLSDVDLWARVDKDPGGGCWIFLGRRDRDGYGLFGRRAAHRLAWRLTRGPIPAGICVLHTCDRPPCCNPDHLFLGTHGDNAADRDNKGRGRRYALPVLRGEKHGGAKLTDAQVSEMRRLLATGERGIDMARDFRVSAKTVSHIKTGHTWKHVP